MAATLDIYMLCREPIGLNIIEKIWEEQNIKVLSLACTDNWLWKNRQPVAGS